MSLAWLKSVVVLYLIYQPSTTTDAPAAGMAICLLFIPVLDIPIAEVPML